MKAIYSLLLLCTFLGGNAQFSRNAIYSDFVLYERRVNFDSYMRERTIDSIFKMPFSPEREDYYREACWAISQFMVSTNTVEKGFAALFRQYANLQPSTKRALLEAVYGVYPKHFKNEVTSLLATEQDAKLFSMEMVYLFRLHADTAALLQLLRSKYDPANKPAIIQALEHYIQYHPSDTTNSLPPLTDFFQQAKNTGTKWVYSFQRWDRDQPGLAIIQHADGSFSRDANGQLLVFEQLARSASDLPYFITNGSTPQGIFSIQGTAISNNKFIGPTPNIQLIMPFEDDSAYWHGSHDSSKAALDQYQTLVPSSWRAYRPVLEVWEAGKIGRTEIIAHGTTIDPDYFKDKPYYPLTPTMGCLCAKESWNIFTGKINQSDQLNLTNAFLSTPGDRGFLLVINLNNQHQPVTRTEVETLVNQFEQKRN